ncbi:MAG: hypothetical protein ACI8W8_003451 [Rhodothermales bacterium]|jgi:hypothetical protein
MSHTSFWPILALLSLTVGAAIPGLPDLGNTPVYDDAALISPEDSEKIQALQVTAFDDEDVMITPN